MRKYVSFSFSQKLKMIAFIEYVAKIAKGMNIGILRALRKRLTSKKNF